MLRPPPASPVSMALPASFSPRMAHSVAAAVPPAVPDEPPGTARQALAAALGMVRDLCPRDAYEACLVQQMVILQLRVPASMALAAVQADDPKRMERWERHAMALTRCAAALERRLRQYRREQAAEQAPAGPEAWDCDLAALEEAQQRAAAVEADAPPPPARPMAAPANATAQPLSRQMRRALERKERKQQLRAERAAALLQRLARVA